MLAARDNHERSFDYGNNRLIFVTMKAIFLFFESVRSLRLGNRRRRSLPAAPLLHTTTRISVTQTVTPFHESHNNIKRVVLRGGAGRGRTGRGAGHAGRRFVLSARCTASRRVRRAAPCSSSSVCRTAPHRSGSSTGQESTPSYCQPP